MNRLRHARLALIALVLTALTFTPLGLVPDSAIAAPGKSRAGGIYPRPQAEQRLSGSVRITPTARLVAGPGTDPAAEAALINGLRRHGIKISTTAGHPTIVLGTPRSTPQTHRELQRLRLGSPQALPDQGYLLAVGADTVVLAGKDDPGTFYAVQSFLQLLPQQVPGQIRALVVKDWPDFAERAGMESFYGPVWSQQDRRDQIDFLARMKANEFFYGPADDRRTGPEWDSPYPADELAGLAEIVERAQDRHITWTYRVSPESPVEPQRGICHADPADRRALETRFEQLYEIGVRSFVVAWDDVPGLFVCDLDREHYAEDLVGVAQAQTEVVNHLVEHFIATHPGTRLSTVPREYWTTDVTPYRSTFDRLLATQVEIYWTGPQVVSGQITAADLAAAQQAFPRHELRIWDNYPVNDFAPDRLLLGPLVNRSADLAAGARSISFNEMVQQAPSQIALFTALDYAWNSAAYEPETSWREGIRRLGGAEADALLEFAALARWSPLEPAGAVELAGLLDAFDRRYSSGKPLGSAERDLRGRLRDYQRVEAALTRLPYARLAEQVQPWARKLTLEAEGAERALGLLSRPDAGSDAAWQQRQQLIAAYDRAKAIGQNVAERRLGDFIATSLDRNQRATGIPTRVTGVTVVPTSEGDPQDQWQRLTDGQLDTAAALGAPPTRGDQLNLRTDRPHRLNRLSIFQHPDAFATGAVEIRSGSGWSQVGRVSSAAETLRLPGIATDQLRIRWDGSATAPKIHEIFVHDADQSPVTLTSDQGRTIAVGAGQTRPLQFRLEGVAPKGLATDTAVDVPDGWTVTPVEQHLQLRSNGRWVGQTISFDATPPADAEGSFSITVNTRVNAAVRSEELTVQVVRPSDRPYRDQVLAQSPAGYWPLDEESGAVTAADHSGVGNDAQSQGPVAFGVPGRFGRAAELVGSQLVADRDRSGTPSGPFTAEAWIMIDSASAEDRSIIESYEAPARNGFALRVTGNRLQGWTMNGSASSVVTAVTPLSSTDWHHVALVHDGRRLTVYLDGVVAAELDGAVTPTPSRKPIRIGGRGDDGARPLNGAIDEVALYDSGLPADEIARHAVTR